MRSLHETLAWFLILTNAAVGVWCLAAQQWPALRGRPVWGGVIVAQALVFAQAVVGALLSQQPGVPLDDMHALYGFSAIIAAMIMYGYRSSPFLRGRELLLYGFGSLFVMGLGLRNLYLG